jgi:hypothetical protein
MPAQAGIHFKHGYADEWVAVADQVQHWLSAGMSNLLSV